MCISEYKSNSGPANILIRELNMCSSNSQILKVGNTYIMEHVIITYALNCSMH